ncbi:DUF4097 family beta strand repeat-containing protein [Niallia nealsonii]|uniref:DUF4097 domain-containing protein n=1 Tax=Niallia nealsonii TaxID=115979 RepID=A0A2N0Z711_9BACI|nr:DUF4097 family beta strand repeat-containing protein [Niallia nealsonii]PKG25305.1 hypothetical protein CWS01_02170 [Niallia nealsonii]
MINFKKILMIATFLIVIGAVGSLLTFRLVDKGGSIQEKRTFDQKNITAIEVDSDNARVEIVPSKDMVMKVELSGKGAKDDKKDFSAKVEGDTLLVSMKKEDFRFFHFDLFTKSLTLKVILPEKQYDSLAVNNDNGYVQIKDLNVKRLDAETNNGRVDLKKIISSNVNVETDNGKLTLDDVSGNIKGKTNNGRISIKTADLDRSIQLETDNGSIEIETEKEPTNVAFDVQVDNGRVNILDKYEGDAVIGNGDNIVKLKTNNGRISVTK